MGNLGNAVELEVIAAAGTLILALITLSFQAYKSAVSNPVNALK
jgi:hypothetical protein